MRRRRLVVTTALALAVLACSADSRGYVAAPETAILAGRLRLTAAETLSAPAGGDPTARWAIRTQVTVVNLTSEVMEGVTPACPVSIRLHRDRQRPPVWKQESRESCALPMAHYALRPGAPGVFTGHALVEELVAALGPGTYFVSAKVRLHGMEGVVDAGVVHLPFAP